MMEKCNLKCSRWNEQGRCMSGRRSLCRKLIAAERDFYREQLERIATHKRKTLAVRLAASALAFWDETTSPNNDSATRVV